MTSAILSHPALSRTMQGGDMLQADEVVAMLRLHELGWGRYRKNLDARGIRFADIFERAELYRLNSLPGAVRSTGLMIGFASVFSGMTVMRM